MSIEVTQHNLPEIVSDLEKMLDELNEKDRTFAGSLINGKYGYHKRNGNLSQNQRKWIGIMYERALGIEPTNQREKSEKVGDLSGLVSFFTEAKQKLKWPKIVLEVKGEPLKLTLAGPQSSFPGTINITDGGPWGDNKWYGRVTEDGEWMPSKVVTPELRSIISRTLSAFSKDPKHAAMTYGHMSSSCCFCNKQLDTKESVAAGYGPVCADKWGLPWGDV